MFDISLYYSVFNMLFSFLCLDMSIKDEDLRWMKHSKIPKFIGKYTANNLLQSKILHTFEGMRKTREELSYLSSPTALGKFQIISRKPKFSIIKTDEQMRIKKKVDLTYWEYCTLTQHLIMFTMVEFIMLFKAYENLLNREGDVYHFKCFSVITNRKEFLENFYITSVESKKSRKEKIRISFISNGIIFCLGKMLEKNRKQAEIALKKPKIN